MKPLQLFQKPMLVAPFLFVSFFCYSQATEQWVKRYNGPANGDDHAKSLAVDALGNVYVTGFSFGTGGTYDYVTVKYDAKGKLLWTRRYDGLGSDQAASLAVDDFGNAYVTGWSGSSSNPYSYDYVTIKYDTDGAELWIKRYNGTGNDEDKATALAVDATSNVYVTGRSTGGYATIKYNAAGAELWVKRYNGTGNWYDEAHAIAVDDLGNVYVTGRSVRVPGDDENPTDIDYATIKYDAAGNELWVARYNGPGHGDGGATSLAVDAAGNVYVTGSSTIDAYGYEHDYATIKYDAAGKELWVKRYSGGSARSLAVDAAGNVYVTGAATGTKYEFDYATIKYDAQGNELWVKRYEGGEASSLAVDASGNVYVTGYSFRVDSSADYTTIKYDKAGAELWVKKYSRPRGYDNASSLAIDASGNVYITGENYGSQVYIYAEWDYATIKYDTNGAEQWVERYNSPANASDAARSLAADAAGNVYVTGESNGDFVTIKYDATGAERWVRRYDGPENYDDSPAALAVDASGNVYVTGRSGSSNPYSNGNDFVTIRYGADGTEHWVRRYNGPENYDDGATALAVDASGNVYVTGYSNSGITTYYDYATIKYDAAGNELWVKRYDGPARYDDKATSLAVDGFGNVYVTGGSHGTTIYHPDYATIKYDMEGNELWVQRYNTLNNNLEGARSLAVDGSGNVYVTGSMGTIKYSAAGNQLWRRSESNDDNQAASLALDGSGNIYVIGQGYDSTGVADYATIKYDAAGNKLWMKQYNGPGSGFDKPTSLAVDGSGNVYVTGSSDGNGSQSDYATIKYDTDGAELWVKRYNGPENVVDGASSLAVDGSENVHVTGSSYDGVTKDDYVTIKYSQTQTSVVSSFTLINADSDEATGELKDGDTLNLAVLASLNLNIHANTNPDAVGSVVFALSGAEMHNHTENIVPYALFADNNNGDYYSWTPSNGNYTLTATPYSAAKGKGEKGTPLTIHFTITGTAVSNLILVNAETDQDIKTLQNGDVIDLSTLPTIKLNIRAVTHPDTVGSVVFNLDHRIIVRENLAPYAIGGDIRGDYRAWTLPTGYHTLIATPYDGKYGRGKKGKARNVSFTVVDRSATTRATKGQQKPISDALQTTEQSLHATPNPFSAHTTISFSVPRSGHITLQVYDIKGIEVERLYQGWTEGKKIYNVPFYSKQLPGGVYVVKISTDKYIQSCKLVLIR